MKMSRVPPHTRPVSYLGFWLRLKVRLRGFSFSITSRAACQTSASTQPPPMVPAIEPSSRTSIFAVSNEGIEPRTLTIVATAPRRPSCRSLTISSYMSIKMIILRLTGEVNVQQEQAPVHYAGGRSQNHCAEHGLSSQDGTLLCASFESRDCL